MPKTLTNYLESKGKLQVAQKKPSLIKKVVKGAVKGAGEVIKATTTLPLSPLQKGVGTVISKIGPTVKKVGAKIGKIYKETPVFKPLTAFAPAPGEEEKLFEEEKAVQAEFKKTPGALIEAIAPAYVRSITGGIVKPETALTPASSIYEKVGDGIGSVMGAVQALKGIATGINRLAVKSGSLVSFIRAHPTIYKYAVNIGAFTAYGQLDPALGKDVPKRLKQVGYDVATGGLFTTLGSVKGVFSIPASFGLGFGLSKLGGGSTEDAIISGAILSVLDASSKLGGRGWHNVTGAQTEKALMEQSRKTLNLPEKFTDADLKMRYRSLAHKYHPDKPGGSQKKMAEINEAYSFLQTSAKKGGLTLKPEKPETKLIGQAEVKAEVKVPKKFVEYQQVKKAPQAPKEAPKIVPETKEVKREIISGAENKERQMILKKLESFGVSGTYFDDLPIEELRKEVTEYEKERVPKEKEEVFYQGERGKSIAEKHIKQLFDLGVKATIQKTEGGYNLIYLKGNTPIFDKQGNITGLEKPKIEKTPGAEKAVKIIKQKTTKELRDELIESGGHPEIGKQTYRSEYIEEIQSRGREEVMKDLGWPTEDNALYRNRHTGDEQTLESLMFIDEAGLARGETPNYELPFILENWIPAKGRNTIKEKYEAEKKAQEEKAIAEKKQETKERKLMREKLKAEPGVNIGDIITLKSKFGKTDSIKVTKITDNEYVGIGQQGITKDWSLKFPKSKWEIVPEGITKTEETLPSEVKKYHKKMDEKAAEFYKEPEAAKKRAEEKIKALQEKPAIKETEEFKVGDIIDTQGHSNMVSPATIREITGNTLKFTDAEGTDFAGMQRSDVRRFIKEGIWKRVVKPDKQEKPVVGSLAAEVKQRIEDNIVDILKPNIPLGFATLPQMQGVLIDGNKIIVNNLESAIIYEMDQDSGIKKVIPFKEIKTKSLADVLKFAKTIKGIPFDEFPITPEITKPVGEMRILLDPKIIEKVLKAVNIESYRTEIAGIQLTGLARGGKEKPGRLRLAGTDSFRLWQLYIPAKIEKPFQVILPGSTAKVLIQLLKKAKPGVLDITTGKELIEIKFGNLKFISKLIEGDYPDYKQIIDEKHKTGFTIGREELLEVVKQLKPYVDNFNAISLKTNFETGKLTLTASRMVEEKLTEESREVPIQIIGKPTVSKDDNLAVIMPIDFGEERRIKGDIVVKQNFLEDTLKYGEKDERVEIMFSEKKKPLIIREQEARYFLGEGDTPVFDISKEEAEKIFREVLTPEEVDFAIVKEVSLTPDAFGVFRTTKGAFSSQYKALVEVIEENGKVSSAVVYHEALHAYINKFVSQRERDEIFKIIQRRYKTKTERETEEELAEQFAFFNKKGKTFAVRLAEFFRKIIAFVRKIFGKRNRIQGLFNDIIAKKRPPMRTEAEMQEIERFREPVIPKDLEPLAQEARKYGSAEEFDNAIKKSKILSDEELPQKIRNARGGYDRARATGDFAEITREREALEQEIQKWNAEESKKTYPLNLYLGGSTTRGIVMAHGEVVGGDKSITADTILRGPFLLEKEKFAKALYKPKILDKTIDEITEEDIPKMLNELEMQIKEVPKKWHTEGTRESELYKLQQQLAMLKQLKNELDFDSTDFYNQATGKIERFRRLTPEEKAQREKEEMFAEGLRTGKRELREKIRERKLEREAKHKQANALKKEIGFIRHTKDLRGNVMQRLKEVYGVREWKGARVDQLEGILADLKDLQPGDTFLTDKQVIGLSHFLKDGGWPNPNLVTKREMTAKFGEPEDILQGKLVKHLSTYVFPTVDIKQDHPIIEREVNRVDIEMRKENIKAKQQNHTLNELMAKAEKSREQGILKMETNRKIFEKLSGLAVDLTPEETEVADYLKEYFNNVREEFALEKYRKNYITNIEAPLFEKIIRTGSILGAIRETFMKHHELDIPVDVMLALDNIIGSEKFFRFALERKGGITPTFNIRKIFKEYSQIVASKKALDRTLPEAQAVQQLLLKRHSALWFKRWLQNAKGRALDSGIQRGRMSWAARLGDRTIGLGYVAGLGLNYMSTIKNIVGGEANSFIWQGPKRFIRGKTRLVSNPKKANRILTKFGLLDGSFLDVAMSDLPGKVGRLFNKVAFIGMQGGEFEIRGSLLVGELTPEEWKTESVSWERLREIIDKFAITQGVYTKTDSPLFVQTAGGRAVMQFGRWKLTNTLMMRRMINGAKQEWKEGNKTGPNSKRLARTFFVTSLAMFLSWQFGKLGWKKAKKVAQAGAELVLLVRDMITGEAFREIFLENYTMQFFDMFVNTTTALAHYIGLREKPYPIEIKDTLDDLWISAIDQFGLRKKKKAGGIKIKKPGGGTQLKIKL